MVINKINNFKNSIIGNITKYLKGETLTLISYCFQAAKIETIYIVNILQIIQ